METWNHDGHRLRLRELVREKGIEALKPHEVIEFLLYYRKPRQDVSDLAKALIAEFGSVEGVLLKSDYKSLLKVPGVGMTMAEWLMEIGEFVRYLITAKSEEEMETHMTVLDSFKYMCRIHEEYPPPSTVMLCYNMNYQLIYQREITPSRMWAAPEVVREALDDVLRLKARHMVVMMFVGNLPPEPGHYDKLHIRPFAYTTCYAGCDLLDFVISSWHGTYSMYQTGELPRFRKHLGKVSQIHDYQKKWPSSNYNLDFVEEEVTRKKERKLKQLMEIAAVMNQGNGEEDPPIDEDEVGVDRFEGENENGTN